jgi:hypothetical protein
VSGGKGKTALPGLARPQTQLVPARGSPNGGRGLVSTAITTQQHCLPSPGEPPLSHGGDRTHTQTYTHTVLQMHSRGSHGRHCSAFPVWTRGGFRPVHCPTAGTTRKRGATRLADLPLPLTHTHTITSHTPVEGVGEREGEIETTGWRERASDTDNYTSLMAL